jgi:integrase
MQHMTRAQLLGLLKAAKDESERDYAALLVGFGHGLRISEILSLTPKSFVDGFLVVQRCKGSLKTVQPLMAHPEPLLNEKRALTAYLEGIGSGERLFPVSRQYFHRRMIMYGQKADIPRPLLHPHVLKHTCAMLTIQKAGIENLKAYLGHKSIASTGAYLKVDDQAASKAIGAAMRF